MSNRTWKQQLLRRRTVLKTVSKAGIVTTIGTGTTIAQSHNQQIQIKHSQSNLSATSTNEGDFDRAVSNKLNIVSQRGEYIEFGGNAGRKLRVTNLDTNRQVTLDPTVDAETVNASRLRPEPDGEPDENGIVSNTITAIGLENRDETAIEIEVEVTGDVDPFPDGTFGRFEVALLDQSDGVISSTDERIIGTGYQYNFEQDNSTVRITREPAVNEAWEVAFAVADDEVFVIRSPDDVIDVENNAEDDEFVIDLTRLDVPPGLYDWELVIATPGTDMESLEEHGADNSNIIVTLNQEFLDPVQIQAESEEAGSEISDSVPGFGIGSGIAALGGTGYMLRRRLTDDSA